MNYNYKLIIQFLLFIYDCIATDYAIIYWGLSTYMIKIGQKRWRISSSAVDTQYSSNIECSNNATFKDLTTIPYSIKENNYCLKKIENPIKY